MKTKTAQSSNTTSRDARFPLVDAFIGIWQKCRPAFVQDRTHDTGLTLAFGLLTALGRRTISRGICARAFQHFDWSRFYRFFSKDIWFPVVLTHQILSEVAEHLQDDCPLVIGVDDTTTPKTGAKIPGSGYFYDAKSPAFARSFKWALRFITISALITPYGPIAAATSILIKLKLAPTLVKPKKSAPADEQKQYTRFVKHWSLTTQLVEQIQLIRAQMDAIPYQTCQIFAAGRWHSLRYKSVAPILWKSAGCSVRLRLIIIAPLSYRLSRKSKRLYRRPAYLLVTDADYPVTLAIQHYFHRWQIEVNHRDAKNNFGVGDAQVRHPRSVARQFSFAALIYSILSLSGLRAYGPSRTANYTPRPKWRNDPRSRPSANDLATQLRLELWCREANVELVEFSADPVLPPNAPKYLETAQVWLAQTVPKGLPLTAWSAILHAHN